MVKSSKYPPESVRAQFQRAYRHERVNAQVNFFPDYIDPDDVSPDERNPGGRYYNSPEVFERFHATAYWHNDACMRWERPAQIAAAAAIRARDQRDEVQPLEDRLCALKSRRAWDKLLGGI